MVLYMIKVSVFIAVLIYLYLKSLLRIAQIGLPKAARRRLAQHRPIDCPMSTTRVQSLPVDMYYVLVLIIAAWRMVLPVAHVSITYARTKFQQFIGQHPKFDWLQ